MIHSRPAVLVGCVEMSSSEEQSVIPFLFQFKIKEGYLQITDR